MLKFLRCGQVLLAALFVLSVSSGNIAAEGRPQPLVSPQLLEQTNLKILWQSELPMKKSETLERLFILGNRIYGLSDHNYMVSLDRQKGAVVFSRAVAPAGLPVVGLDILHNELFSVIGNRLVQINPEFGTERSSTALAFVVVCPAARNSLYFYIAGTDRRLHVLRADDKVQIFEAAARNNSMITSIIADENFVVFATDAGNCVGMAPDTPKRLWLFDADGPVAGRIVRDANSLFVSSKDTNVYKLDILTGKLLWKYQTAAVLDRGPRVTRNVVYQYVRNKGLSAIDRRTGKFLWQVPQGADLLAEADQKAYVITDSGELVVMDNKKAEKLYSVNLAPVSRYVTNTADSKIYIAAEAGRIACLEPTE